MFQPGQMVTIKSDDEWNGKRGEIERIWNDGSLSVWIDGADDYMKFEVTETQEHVAPKAKAEEYRCHYCGLPVRGSKWGSFNELVCDECQ